VDADEYEESEQIKDFSKVVDDDYERTELSD